MDSLLENLKKDVQCTLCKDTLTEPKMLPCYDTFCKLCIKRHAELIEEVNVFKCPKCKSETPLPDLNSVEDLKPSLLHSRMVKVLGFIESEKVCSVSGSHPPASWHCFDCDRSLCDECEKSHSVFIKGHKVIYLLGIKEEDLKAMLSRETNCVKHADKVVELFCKDCEDAICLQCFEHDHEGHSIIPLSKYAKSKRALLSDELEQLKLRQQRMERKFKALQEVTELLRESGEKEKREIKKKLGETIKELQMKAMELMNQIDDDVEKAEDIKAKGQCVLDQTRGAMDYMKKLIENGTQTDVIHVKDLEYDNILEKNELIEKIQHLGKMYEFNEELMKQVNSGLGTLRQTVLTVLTDHKMSSIAVETKLEALKESKLIITTRSKTGNLTGHLEDVVEVKISPEDNVEIKKNCVRTEGKIEVEFMAKVAGQLTAEVQVNGNHVSNSPLVMNVMPQKMGITKKFQMKGIKTKSSDFTGIAINKTNSRVAVADQSSHSLHIFNTNGVHLLTCANLRSPQSISFLNQRDLVIADNNGHRICIVNTTTGILVKTFGNQGNANGEFLHPHGVHVDDDGNIIVCDSGNHRVQVFTRGGHYQYQFSLTPNSFFYPLDVVTHDGRFYVSDEDSHVIHVFEKKGHVPTRISTIGGEGVADGQLDEPCGLAIDNDHRLLVCDRGNNRIQKFTLDGRLVGKTSDESCDTPKYLTVLNDGQLLVTLQKRKVFYLDSK